MFDKEFVKIDGDYYARYNFIKKIEKIVDSCVTMDKPMTFSIEGDWGKGKSWIINKLEESIKGLDITKNNNDKDLKFNSGKYLVFKYNAWEKDFYDDPLVAILLSIVNQLNDILLVKNIINEKAKSILKETMVVLEGAISSISKKIFGFDIVNVTRKAYKKFCNLTADAKIKLTINETQNIENDIKIVVEALNKLSSDIPIVFIVDELDRCVPQNAIKTLERFHHVFAKVKLSVTIISVHRKQLDNSIKLMFGNNISTDTYLSKFIDFSISLTNGETDNDQLNENLLRFENLFAPNDDFDLKTEILYNVHQSVNAREFEKICNNAYMCHNIINNDTRDLPKECFIAEILLFACKLTEEKENTSAGFSPEYGNNANTKLGRYLQSFLEPIHYRNLPNDQSKNLIFFILCFVYDFNKSLDLVELKINDKELLRIIKEYYIQYKDVFRVIK